MKTENWSTCWKSSTDIRKQRKYRINAPLHIRGNFVSSHLSKDLREKYKKRAVPLRKGDTVKIMRGTRRGESGKVDVVDRKNYKVYLAGFTTARKSGNEVPISFDASKLMITSLSSEDKLRIKEKQKVEVKKEAKTEVKKEVKPSAAPVKEHKPEKIIVGEKKTSITVKQKTKA